jgi:hypothetical protein
MTSTSRAKEAALPAAVGDIGGAQVRRAGRDEERAHTGAEPLLLGREGLGCRT